MRRIFLLLLLFAAAVNAMAVPAYPEKIVFTQPNSETKVTIYLKGAERVHWAETIDGYSLLHSDDGSLVYAYRNAKGDMVASDIVATEIESRDAKTVDFLKSTPKHLRFSQSQVDAMLSIWKQVEDAKSGPKTMSDVTGQKKFLVILFAFNDKDMTHTRFEFKELFNQVNYTAGGRTGSVRDYYYDVSGGLFTLRVDVVGPYIGAYNTAYYGDSDYGYQEFAHEAVDSAAQDVDFSDYDNDGDGYIDGLHIIFAGHGEEAGGGSDCIWSHKWNIFNAPTYNNTVIDVYSCSPECSGSYGTRITNIGVICHELGHVFGAPDYYDTDYAGSGGEYPGLGQWDIMSSGSWNRGGIAPAHHNPYTKTYIYHWTTCDTIDSTPRTVILNPVENSCNDIHRINTSTPDDFFMIENRQQLKWDQGIPGNGMLVYHIHPHAYGASVSNASHPQQMYILAHTNPTDTFPTSTPSSYGDLNSNSATYPGAYAQRDSLTNNSVPWFRPWSKQPNSVSFYNISSNDNTRQVFFTVGNISPETRNATAEGVDQQSIALRWTPYGSLKTMIVINGNSNIFGVPSGRHNVGDTIDGGSIVVYKGNGTSALVDSLASNHLYNFRLFVCKNDSTYSDGIDAQGRTLNCDNSEWLQEDFETTVLGTLPECWTGDWTVDSLLGQKVIANTPDVSGWQTVSSKPICFESVQDAVLHYRLHFGDQCNTNTIVKTEYRNSAAAEWQTIDSIAWSFGAATWRDVYLLLPGAGDRSRIRFSIYSNGSAQAAIDNVELTKGAALIYASSDANGDINPSGYSVVGNGDTVRFTITPLPGYKPKSLKYDDNTITTQALTVLENGVYQYELYNVSGQHTILVTFEKTNGIEPISENSLNVYPNPAHETITIETTPESTITLYDITGRIVSRQKAMGKTLIISLEGLPEGVYILRDGTSTAKVLKK